MHKSVIDALFPKTRQVVLAAFLLQPEKWWYLSELAKYLGLTPSSLQRELASLTEVQILESKKEGNRVYYKANLLCPGVEEIQSLFIKTTGVTDLLRSAFRKFSTTIYLAFIYGSLARGEVKAASDVDVMIIGDLKLAQIASTLRGVERSLGREVNVTIYSRKEFMRKIKSEDAFIETVLSDKKIFLEGSKVELEKMVS